MIEYNEEKLKKKIRMERENNVKRRQLIKELFELKIPNEFKTEILAGMVQFR